MDRLVRLLLNTKRTARPVMSIASAVGIAASLVICSENHQPTWCWYALGTVFVALFSRAAYLRSRLSSQDHRQTWLDAQLAILLVSGLMALVLRLDGNLDGPTFPILYVALVLTAALTTTMTTAVLTTSMIILEASLRWMSFDGMATWPLVMHGLFSVLFSVASILILKIEVQRIREHAKKRVAAEIERMHNAARSYRLLEAPSAPSSTDPMPSDSHDDKGRLVRSSVEEIHEAVFFALHLLRQSLNLHTAILLWVNDAGTHLRVSEISTESDQISQGPFPLGFGILGAVSSKGGAVNLSHLKPSSGVPYYDGPCPVRNLLAIPALEGDHMRGILVVDRIENQPFNQEDERMLAGAVRYIMRAVQNERVFIQLERAKVEQGKLYRGAKALGAALSERDVMEASVSSAREIASFDFAAVTVFDKETRTHQIRAVSGGGDTFKNLAGKRFRHNTSIVSMVVQNCHPLPYHGRFDPSRQHVFSRQVKAPSYPSILVLPLIVHDRPLGTLVLGSRRHEAFGDAVRSTLEVLATHIAVSLAGARVVRQLEELATKDGMTGLYNKRSLLEIGADKIAAAARFQRPLSMMIVDVDHFKKVNDTHGHDIGDVVLKGLGKLLAQVKRDTDVVGRFGGEEFVVLCEETNPEGAWLLAERIRKKLGATVFQTPKGPLSVTCSVGISSFPKGGKAWDTLFKAADNALYHSKETGRNRCTVWSPKLGGPKKSAA